MTEIEENIELLESYLINKEGYDKNCFVEYNDVEDKYEVYYDSGVDYDTGEHIVYYENSFGIVDKNTYVKYAIEALDYYRKDYGDEYVISDYFDGVIDISKFDSWDDIYNEYFSKVGLEGCAEFVSSDEKLHDLGHNKIAFLVFN